MNKIIKNFVGAKRGNVALMFGIALLAVVMVVGVAVDYTNAERQKSRLQDSIDSAVLAAAKEVDESDWKRKKISEEYFKANLPEAGLKGYKIEFRGQEVYGQATYEVPLTFASILGRESLPVTVEASVAMQVDSLEVALVLDVSGSMRHNLNGEPRIDILKKNSQKLIDKMKALPGNGHKVGIVPFTMTVNVGSDKTSWVYGENDPRFAGTKWAGCVMALPGVRKFQNNPRRQYRAYVSPPLPNGVGSDPSTQVCVDNVSNGTNLGYASLTEGYIGFSYSSQFDGPNRNCVMHAISPLTSNLNDAADAVDALTAEWNDGTIIAEGVTWGLRVLSPEEPFTEGDTWNRSTKKFMIVITDGEQTTEAEFQDAYRCQDVDNTVDTFVYNPSTEGIEGDAITGRGPRDNFTPYGFILDSDPFNSNPNSWADVSDDLQNVSLEACAQAKRDYGAGAITIFTIGVSSATAPGTDVYDLLNKCASQPSFHYFAENSDDIDKAFDDIIKKISDMRLTR